MKSVMTPQERFTKIAAPRISRSTFDRSSGHKTTFNAGYLYPIFVDEALPGDTMNLSVSMLARINTLIKPIQDNIYIDVHFFSVPERLLWDNWEEFMGQRFDPADDPTLLTLPQVAIPSTGTGLPEGTIADYFGLPTLIPTTTSQTLRAGPFRAYNLIWNEWYRDQNLTDSVVQNTDDGPDVLTDYSLLRRFKRKDYFTSALPWAQKADPVTLPFGTTAPVYGDGNTLGITITGSDTFGMGTNGSGLATLGTTTYGQPVNTAQINDGTVSKSFGVVTSGTSGLVANLSSAVAVTINQFREAVQMQYLFELDARGGTRYPEIIFNHFGVISADARLQRPEFLGGFTIPVMVNPVSQTSVSAATPQGNLSGIGTAGGSNRGFIKSFTEHEIVMGIMSARADLTYQQGINRMWSRSTRFDFFWPALANLGEQEILRKELIYNGDATDEQTFGYQERYAEYRYKPSIITGLYRSNATGSIDVWHLSQELAGVAGVATLDSDFLYEDPPMDRIEAVSAEPDFNADIYFNLIHARPIPTFGTPGRMVGL